MRQFQKRGLVPYLLRGPKPFGTSTGSASDGGRVDRNDIPAWPDEDLSWDLFKRTKEELQRSFWFLWRHDQFHQSLVDGTYPFVPLADGMRLRTEGATLRVVHTPGHAAEHCAFLVEEDNDLMSGDHVLGYGTTFFRNLFDYMASLDKMLALKPRRLLPGHGPIIQDGAGYMRRYIEHRTAREVQIVDALAAQGSRAVSAMGLAQVIYVDTPPRKMHMAAENVDKVLVKLLQERRATVWRRVSGELRSASSEVDNGYALPPNDDLLWRIASADASGARL